MPSRSNPAVRLYPDLRGRNRYLCLVVKRESSYSFILTDYSTGESKESEHGHHEGVCVV